MSPGRAGTASIAGLRQPVADDLLSSPAQHRQFACRPWRAFEASSASQCRDRLSARRHHVYRPFRTLGDCSAAPALPPASRCPCRLGAVRMARRSGCWSPLARRRPGAAILLARSWRCRRDGSEERSGRAMGVLAHVALCTRSVHRSVVSDRRILWRALFLVTSWAPELCSARAIFRSCAPGERAPLLLRGRCSASGAECGRGMSALV